MYDPNSFVGSTLLAHESDSKLTNQEIPRRILNLSVNCQDKDTNKGGFMEIKNTLEHFPSNPTRPSTICFVH